MIQNDICRSGSPSMTDIETFSSIYRARLEEAETAGSVPDNLSLEVYICFQLLFASSFFFPFYHRGCRGLSLPILSDRHLVT